MSLHVLYAVELLLMNGFTITVSFSFVAHSYWFCAQTVGYWRVPYSCVIWNKLYCVKWIFNIKILVYWNILSEACRSLTDFSIRIQLFVC